MGTSSGRRPGEPELLEKGEVRLVASEKLLLESLLPLDAERVMESKSSFEGDVVLGLEPVLE